MASASDLLLKLEERRMLDGVVAPVLWEAAIAVGASREEVVGGFVPYFGGIEATLRALIEKHVPIHTVLDLQSAERLALAEGIAVDEVSLDTVRKHLPMLAELLGAPPQPRTSVARSNATPQSTKTDAEYTLFSHQRRAVRRVNRALAEAHTRVILHMPTGSGKTRSAMNVVASHLRRVEPTVVLWVASSKELLEQAMEEAAKAWTALGDREITVAAGWGGELDDASTVTDGVLVASLQSLYTLLKSDEDRYYGLANRVSLMVFDETHQSIARTYKAVTERVASHARLLGLSATPGRTAAGDQEPDRMLAAMFRGRSVTLETKAEGHDNPIDFLVSQGYLADAEFEQVDLPPHADGVGAHTAAVTVEVDHGVKDGHKRVIVFVGRVEHARVVAALLHTKGVSARAVHAGLSSSDRESAIQWFKEAPDEARVLVNVDVLTTGFDAPTTTLCVIARPTKSLVLYSQMVGRAIRGPKAGGSETAKIVTVVESDDRAFSDVAKAFQNWQALWSQSD